jgi:hypothetical protein
MRQAIADNANQYCRSAGLPALAQALAKRYSAYLGREVSWETEVTVGVGASETLFALMQALVDPGDEVLLISPAFDIYSAQVQMAGGVSRYVPLRPVGAPGAQRWVLDLAEFERAFSERTRVLVLNTPHNPTGKCFDANELAAIAEPLLAQWPLGRRGLHRNRQIGPRIGSQRIAIGQSGFDQISRDAPWTGVSHARECRLHCDRSANQLQPIRRNERARRRVATGRVSRCITDPRSSRRSKDIAQLAHLRLQS